MKKITILYCALMCPAIAAGPSTTCPSGYVAIEDPSITIATTCPSDTAAVGTAESCLVSNPSGVCIMYAPAGVSYTDEKGTYEYTEACAME